MFKYEIFDIPNELKIDYNLVDKIFEIVDFILDKSQFGTLNLIFESDENIKELNKNYRKIDSTTDVLSFGYFEDFSSLSESEVVGEILFSFSKILLQSKEYNNSLEEEYYKLLIHSILHILGYDHENDNDYIIMNKIENQIIDKINNLYKINIK